MPRDFDGYDDPPFVEPRYQCALHGYQAEDWPCDACTEADQIAQAVAVELGPAGAANELLLALQRALERVQAKKDEDMGDRARGAELGGSR